MAAYERLLVMGYHRSPSVVFVQRTSAYLHITAFGRQEEWKDSPEGYPQTPPYEWWKWHDEYDDIQPAAERRGADRPVPGPDRPRPLIG